MSMDSGNGAGAARSPAAVIAYYPSSVYVEERPMGMTDVHMARLQRRRLCSDMDVVVCADACDAEPSTAAADGPDCVC